MYLPDPKPHPQNMRISKWEKKPSILSSHYSTEEGLAVFQGTVTAAMATMMGGGMGVVSQP